MNKQEPCANCPFRSDTAFYLSETRVQSILEAILGDDGFTCHKTTNATGKSPGQGRACLGAAIFLEHVRVGGLRANLAFRFRESYLKEFYRDELKLDLPVFTDTASFVAARTNLSAVAD